MRYTLEITPKIGCPYECGFCPQPKLSAEYHSEEKVMNVTKLYDMLLKVPRHVEIHFSGFVEPFSHPMVHEMMALVRQLEFKQLHVYSTLMGIRKEQVRTLQDVAPNVFRVHVPDTKAFVVSPLAWAHHFETFRSTGLHATYMTMGEVPDPIKAILASHGVTAEAPDMLSRGGNLWVPKQIKGPLTCTMQRWYSNVLLPNGDLYLCCHDYGLTCPVGNLLTMDYDQIILNARKYEEDKTPPENSICRKCEWASPI